MAGSGASSERFGSVGSLIDGRYRLERLLGSGGFGEVWHAVQEVEGADVRPVALKLIAAPDSAKPASTPGSDRADGATRWLNEVRAVRDVHCDAIATIYDVGVATESRVGFIAMELLEGETLQARINRGVVYWRRALAIAREIATALEACHAVDVSHCDLKPQNVFVTGDGRICVLDFGVAALGGESVEPAAASAGDEAAEQFGDETGAVDVHEVPGLPSLGPGNKVFGTPGYIAPECFGGQRPGPEADLFALGVVLYSMIAGRLPQLLPKGVAPPSATSTNDEMQRYRSALAAATLRGELAPLEDLAPDVPVEVSNLVARLLSLDPDKRDPSQLRAWLDEVWRRPYGVPDPPYVGLEAFGAQRAGYLAGRDADSEQITEKLRDQRGIVLAGPSGCGKSSLAVAGVVPRMDQSLLGNRDGWRMIRLRPSDGADQMELASSSPGGGRELGTAIVVDQLEEVLGLEEDRRDAFCGALATLAEGSGHVRVGGEAFGPDDELRVIATVRDDLFGRIAALPALRRFPERNLYTVRGVEPNAIPVIVQEPASAAGFAMEGADAVVAEAADLLHDDASALPLVQFALTRWWEQRDVEARTLPKSEWEKIGGIEGALADGAQEIYDRLSESQRDRMRALLVGLFRPDGTRVRVNESDAITDAESRAVLAKLVEGRLVRRHDSEHAASLEVVHEALARRWPPLHGWLEETRAERELIADIEYDAERWRKAGRPPDLLWRGERISAAQRVRAKVGDDADFIDAAMQLGHRARWRRRGVLTVVALLVAGAVVLGLSYLGSNEARERAETALKKAEDREAEAVTARDEAENARRTTEKLADEQARLRNIAEIREREATELQTNARQELEAAKKEADRVRKQADAELTKARTDAKRVRDQADNETVTLRAQLRRESDKNKDLKDEKESLQRRYLRCQEKCGSTK